MGELALSIGLFAVATATALNGWSIIQLHKLVSTNAELTAKLASAQMRWGIHDLTEHDWS